MAASHDREKLCTLEGIVGPAAPCPREACPFWERGYGPVPSACLFDDVAIGLEGTEVARELLALRTRLLDLWAVAPPPGRDVSPR